MNVSQKIDEERYRASMTRLYEILQDMSESINRISAWRCPYKNAEDRCTAKFGCRNKSNEAGQLPVCTGSDDLDYRNAWESEPHVPPLP